MALQPGMSSLVGGLWVYLIKLNNRPLRQLEYLLGLWVLQELLEK
jgi:hypothetical protein